MTKADRLGMHRVFLLYMRQAHVTKADRLGMHVLRDAWPGLFVCFMVFTYSYMSWLAFCTKRSCM